MARTGADVLVEGLISRGVDHVFGMPGSHSTAVYDALGRAAGSRLFSPATSRPGRSWPSRSRWTQNVARAVFNRLDAEPGVTQRHSKNSPVSPLRKGGKKSRRRQLSPPCEGGVGGVRAAAIQCI